MNFKVFIISHKRSDNVKKVQDFLAYPVTWIVGTNEKNDYDNAGALNVVEGGSLVDSRNMALDIAFKENCICVQLSDDIKKLELLSFPDKIKKELSFVDALTFFEQELPKTPFKLYGVPPTPNAFYVHKPISKNLFIIGDFIVVKPCELRFDSFLRLKEDYDYTVQHIKKYGGVIRLDFILATFSHYSNSGGAVSVRTEILEQEMIKYLMTKHPGFFKHNPRRRNEILISRFKPLK